MIKGRKEGKGSKQQSCRRCYVVIHSSDGNRNSWQSLGQKGHSIMTGFKHNRMVERIFSEHPCTLHQDSRTKN